MIVYYCWHIAVPAAFAAGTYIVQSCCNILFFAFKPKKSTIKSRIKLSNIKVRRQPYYGYRRKLY